METNEENSNGDLGNDLSKNLPSGGEIIRENSPASEDEMPIHKIKLIKTKFDSLVELLDLFSSIAMVVVTVFIAIFAFKQWNAAEEQVIAANKQVEAANKQIDLVSKQTVAAEKQSILADEQIKIAKAQNEFMRLMNLEQTRSTRFLITPNLGAKWVIKTEGASVQWDLMVSNYSSFPVYIKGVILDFPKLVGFPKGVLGGSFHIGPGKTEHLRTFYMTKELWSTPEGMSSWPVKIFALSSVGALWEADFMTIGPEELEFVEIKPASVNKIKKWLGSKQHY